MGRFVLTPLSLVLREKLRFLRAYCNRQSDRCEQSRQRQWVMEAGRRARVPSNGQKRDGKDLAPRVTVLLPACSLDMLTFHIAGHMV